MKRTTAVIVLMLLFVAVALPFSASPQTVLAQEAEYSIQSVEHQVEIMYSGHVVIRDTISLAGQLNGDFYIGFPYKYGSFVLKGIAYDTNNIFPVSLGVPLNNRSGFYGAKISFPEGAPQVFTVLFILSNNLVSQNLERFILDFPAYPTLVRDAATCNVDLVFPGEVNTRDFNITKDDGIVETTNFVKENLPAFAYSPAKASFVLNTGSLQIVTIKELNRRITISPVGDVKVSDSYRIANNSPESITSFEVDLPSVASNIIAKDEFGRRLETNDLDVKDNIRSINVTFTDKVASNKSTIIKAEYVLPRISSEQESRFILDFDLLPDFNYYIDLVTVAFIPPEGARFIMPQLSIDSSTSLIREIFQETLSIRREGVSKISHSTLSDILQITFDYSPLWVSFRPTLWMWALAIVGCVVMIAWRKTKSSKTQQIAIQEISVSISPDRVKAFTETYDEKNRLTSELKSLEERAQKGKISRRRYKVQKRTLTVRFEALERQITESRKDFHNAGGLYANLVRQLDLSEIELVEIETSIRNIEVRHRVGELPLGKYKKSLADLQHRKEKAEAAINGILLRLREESR